MLKNQTFVILIEGEKFYLKNVKKTATTKKKVDMREIERTNNNPKSPCSAQAAATNRPGFRSKKKRKRKKDEPNKIIKGPPRCYVET